MPECLSGSLFSRRTDAADHPSESMSHGDVHMGGIGYPFSFVRELNSRSLSLSLSPRTNSRTLGSACHSTAVLFRRLTRTQGGEGLVWEARPMKESGASETCCRPIKKLQMAADAGSRCTTYTAATFDLGIDEQTERRGVWGSRKSLDVSLSHRRSYLVDFLSFFFFTLLSKVVFRLLRQMPSSLG